MRLLGHHGVAHAVVPIPRKATVADIGKDEHRWDGACEVGQFKLTGIMKVTIDKGDYIAEADALDAIRHMTKSWRSHKSWRCGFGEELVLKYSDVMSGGARDMVMELEDGRSHTHIKFVASLSNLCMIVHDGKYIAFMQKNLGSNVLAKELLAKPDGYVCIVCEAASESKASHFTEDMRHLVTEAVVGSVMAQRKQTATFHRTSGALQDDDGGAVYGFEEDPNGGMVNHRALWFRGRLHHRESETLRSKPDTQNGDFYIRESSSKGNFTLTVVVSIDEGAVAHFRIVTKHIEDRLNSFCYIEGHESVTFSTLTELVEFYDSKGLGMVHGRKVKLLRAMGCSNKGSVMEQKLEKMNKLLRRGFNF
eukprot:m.21816 g.21816  ORF g.21816 m.21816 type:complete len:364 (+) comp10559_c0_seq1:257-1348(+)